MALATNYDALKIRPPVDFLMMDYYFPITPGDNLISLYALVSVVGCADKICIVSLELVSKMVRYA